MPYQGSQQHRRAAFIAGSSKTSAHCGLLVSELAQRASNARKGITSALMNSGDISLAYPLPRRAAQSKARTARHVNAVCLQMWCAC